MRLNMHTNAKAIVIVTVARGIDLQRGRAAENILAIGHARAHKAAA